MASTWTELDPALRERIEQKRFWNQMLAEYDFTNIEFCQEIFADGYDDQLSPEALAIATTTLRDRKWAETPKYIEDIGSCGTPWKPGVLPAHLVEITVNKKSQLVELPEVRVEIDTKQYETMLKLAPKRETDFLRVYGRVLCYCYRLGLPVGRLSAIAMERTGWKLSEHERLQENAKKYSHLVATTDMWLADWFTKASAYCNTMSQVDILIDVYVQAAKYNTRQPRINKLAVSDRTKANRTVIRRLFLRLVSAGLMIEQPEKYTYEQIKGRPNSEARIVNLDPMQQNRWNRYEALPSIDRSAIAENRQVVNFLRKNGQWMGTKPPQ